MRVAPLTATESTELHCADQEDHPEGASPERQRTPDRQVRGEAALIVSRAPLKGLKREKYRGSLKHLKTII